MQEDFLHYIWKFKKFNLVNIHTTTGLPIGVLNTGSHNSNSGPDFFNGKIRIGEELWAGNIEIHIKSSDWYAHGHETDPAYDNVILHVVWDEDVDIYRKDNSAIPTLELKDLVPEKVMEGYRHLLLAPNDKWINCERDFPGFDSFTIDNWLERLYLERLQEKFNVIQQLLTSTENNWEAVLFRLLAKNFGLKVNGGAFLSMAQSFDFKVVQKCRNNPKQLESLLLGQSGLLEKDVQTTYFQELKEEYQFLKIKFTLENRYIERPKFFRLRPDNFPNIRLSQLANLYAERQHLFSNIISAKDIKTLRQIFEVETSAFWKTHYSFEKSHSIKTKKLTDSFIDLLIINSIVPLRFCYLQKTGTGDTSQLLQIIQEITCEKNSIIDKFNRIRPKTAKSALHSQALLHMKQQYCDKNGCLNCALGVKLVQGN